MAARCTLRTQLPGQAHDQLRRVRMRHSQAADNINLATDHGLIKGSDPATPHDHHEFLALDAKFW